MNLQDHDGVSNAAPADSPLHPLPLPGLDEIHTKGRVKEQAPLAHIHDYIDGLRFRISPTAFFQVLPVIDQLQVVFLLEQQIYFFVKYPYIVETCWKHQITSSMYLVVYARQP